MSLKYYLNYEKATVPSNVLLDRVLISIWKNINVIKKLKNCIHVIQNDKDVIFFINYIYVFLDGHNKKNIRRSSSIHLKLNAKKKIDEREIIKILFQINVR